MRPLDANPNPTPNPHPNPNPNQEEARNETPGPGAYLKLDLSTATLRRGGSPIFGRSTSPRFEPSPSLDRLTPSPVHYAPDHTRPSRG